MKVEFKLKRIFCLILALVLVLGLAACGSTDDDPDGSGSGDSSGSGDDDEYSFLAYSDGLDERGFFAGVTASDYVTLPAYMGASFPEEPDPDEVAAFIEDLLAENPRYERITGRAVEDGDTVNIDYVGSMDGVEFEGGSTGGKGTTVTIGVTSYIDDFLEQLIGHMPGENFDIEVTFPDPYPNNTDFSGKDAVFNITINYIQGEEMEAELDEDFAGLFGYDTVDELLEAVDFYILGNEQSKYMDELLSSAECTDIPQSVLECLANQYKQQFLENAAYYGVDAEMLASLYGYEDLDALVADSADEIRESAVWYLTVQAIAEKEGIEVTAEDIAEAQAEEAIKYYGEPYVKFYLLGNLVVPDYIFDHRAKPTE